jgi:hypothetical protein
VLIKSRGLLKIDPSTIMLVHPITAKKKNK